MKHTYCPTLENLQATLKQKTGGGRIVFCGDGGPSTYMKYDAHIKPYASSAIFIFGDNVESNERLWKTYPTFGAELGTPAFKPKLDLQEGSGQASSMLPKGETQAPTGELYNRYPNNIVGFPVCVDKADTSVETSQKIIHAIGQNAIILKQQYDKGKTLVFPALNAGTINIGTERAKGRMGADEPALQDFMREAVQLIATTKDDKEYTLALNKLSVQTMSKIKENVEKSKSQADIPQKTAPATMDITQLMQTNPKLAGTLFQEMMELMAKTSKLLPTEQQNQTNALLAKIISAQENANKAPPPPESKKVYKHNDTPVNEGYEYDGRFIAKVLERHIQKKGLGYRTYQEQEMAVVDGIPTAAVKTREGLYANDSLFNEDGRTLRKLSGMLVKNDKEKTLYKNEFGHHVSIAQEVDYKALNLGQEKNLNLMGITHALQGVRFLKSKLPDNIPHDILFPYHINAGHWGCAVIHMNFDNKGVPTGYSIDLQDPLRKQNNVRPEIAQGIKNAVCTTFKVEEKALKIQANSEKYVEIQNDGTSCGAISAELGKDVIDGDKEHKRNHPYPEGAGEIRLQHLQEINDPHFTKVQFENKHYVVSEREIPSAMPAIQKGLDNVLPKIPGKEAEQLVIAFQNLNTKQDALVRVATIQAIRETLVKHEGVLKGEAVGEKSNLFAEIFNISSTGEVSFKDGEILATLADHYTVPELPEQGKGLGGKGGSTGGGIGSAGVAAAKNLPSPSKTDLPEVFKNADVQALARRGDRHLYSYKKGGAGGHPYTELDGMAVLNQLRSENTTYNTKERNDAKLLRPNAVWLNNQRRFISDLYDIESFGKDLATDMEALSKLAKKPTHLMLTVRDGEVWHRVDVAINAGKKPIQVSLNCDSANGKDFDKRLQKKIIDPLKGELEDLIFGKEAMKDTGNITYTPTYNNIDQTGGNLHQQNAVVMANAESVIRKEKLTIPAYGKSKEEQAANNKAIDAARTRHQTAYQVLDQVKERAGVESYTAALTQTSQERLTAMYNNDIKQSKQQFKPLLKQNDYAASMMSILRPPQQLAVHHGVMGARVKEGKDLTAPYEAAELSSAYKLVSESPAWKSSAHNKPVPEPKRPLRPRVRDPFTGFPIVPPNAMDMDPEVTHPHPNAQFYIATDKEGKVGLQPGIHAPDQALASLSGRESIGVKVFTGPTTFIKSAASDKTQADHVTPIKFIEMAVESCAQEGMTPGDVFVTLLHQSSLFIDNKANKDGISTLFEAYKGTYLDSNNLQGAIELGRTYLTHHQQQRNFVSFDKIEGIYDIHKKDTGIGIRTEKATGNKVAEYITVQDVTATLIEFNNSLYETKDKQIVLPHNVDSEKSLSNGQLERIPNLMYNVFDMRPDRYQKQLGKAKNAEDILGELVSRHIMVTLAMCPAFEEGYGSYIANSFVDTVVDQYKGNGIKLNREAMHNYVDSYLTERLGPSVERNPHQTAVQCLIDDIDDNFVSYPAGAKALAEWDGKNQKHYQNLMDLPPGDTQRKYYASNKASMPHSPVETIGIANLRRAIQLVDDESTPFTVEWLERSIAKSMTTGVGFSFEHNGHKYSVSGTVIKSWMENRFPEHVQEIERFELAEDVTDKVKNYLADKLMDYSGTTPLKALQDTIASLPPALCPTKTLLGELEKMKEEAFPITEDGKLKLITTLFENYEKEVAKHLGANSKAALPELDLLDKWAVEQEKISNPSGKAKEGESKDLHEGKATGKRGNTSTKEPEKTETDKPFTEFKKTRPETGKAVVQGKRRNSESDEEEQKDKTDIASLPHGDKAQVAQISSDLQQQNFTLAPEQHPGNTVRQTQTTTAVPSKPGHFMK